LKLQVPDENVGDMLVELTNVTKGPEQRQCCCDEKAKKCNGRNSQRQGRLEIEVERHIGFYRRRSLPQPLIAQEFTFSALPAPSVQKEGGRRWAICPKLLRQMSVSLLDAASNLWEGNCPH
jgi:hypothetical protein